MINKLLGELYWEEFEDLLKDLSATYFISEEEFFWVKQKDPVADLFFHNFLNFLADKSVNPKVRWNPRQSIYSFVPPSLIMPVSLNQLVKTSQRQSTLIAFKEEMIRDITDLILFDQAQSFYRKPQVGYESYSSQLELIEVVNQRYALEDDLNNIYKDLLKEITTCIERTERRRRLEAEND